MLILNQMFEARILTAARAVEKSKPNVQSSYAEKTSSALDVCKTKMKCTGY